MAEPHAHPVRPDIDILGDVQNVIVHYPPLNADRHQMDVKVVGGVVVINGITQSPINRRYLTERLPLIEGVTGVNIDHWYDEETIRLLVGRVLPQGVIANIRYGSVVLSSDSPDVSMLDTIAQEVTRVPGVQRVLVRA